MSPDPALKKEKIRLFLSMLVVLLSSFLLILIIWLQHQLKITEITFQASLSLINIWENAIGALSGAKLADFRMSGCMTNYIQYLWLKHKYDLLWKLKVAKSLLGKTLQSTTTRNLDVQISLKHEINEINNTCI